MSKPSDCLNRFLTKHVNSSGLVIAATMILVAVIDLFKPDQTRSVISLCGKDVVLCRLRAIKRGA